MKLFRLVLFSAVAVSMAAFLSSCESGSNLDPFWSDDGGANGAMGRGNGLADPDAGFGNGSGLNPSFGAGSGLSGADLNSPTGYGEEVPYIDGFGARIPNVTFQPVYFQYDQNTITVSEESKVKDVAEFLLNHSEAGVIIEGYCDERGTDEYNRALGERRTLAAKLLLLDYGIEESRLKGVSYGEERPAVTGSGEAVWKLNRRDEFIPVYLLK